MDRLVQHVRSAAPPFQDHRAGGPFAGQLLDQYGKQIIMEVMNRLLTTHYLGHNHPNDWGRLFRRRGIQILVVMEMTFLRKDRATPSDYVRSFPNTLDIINNEDLPVMRLPDAWHASPGDLMVV